MKEYVSPANYHELGCLSLEAFGFRVYCRRFGGNPVGHRADKSREVLVGSDLRTRHRVKPRFPRRFPTDRGIAERSTPCQRTCLPGTRAKDRTLLALHEC